MCGDHVLVGALPFDSNRGSLGQLTERTRREHDCNHPAVLYNVDAPKRSDILEQTAEVVLRVASGYFL